MSKENDEHELPDDDEVERFLKEFKTQMEVFGVFFMGRQKNQQALLDLGITPDQREEVLKELKVKDYSEGPKKEQMMQGGNLWVFGKEYRGVELYIKISLGQANDRTVCISFHIAEHPMSYPFKRDGDG